MNIFLGIYLAAMFSCIALMTLVTYLDYKIGEDVTISSLLWVVCPSIIPLINILVPIICLYFLFGIDKKSWNNGVYTVLIEGKRKL